MNGMRVLHVHDKANFVGGIERIVHDLAIGLADYGWPQGLLFTQGGSNSEFVGAFSWSGMDIAEAIECFCPDVVLIHKLENSEKFSVLVEKIPSILMVHDHDISCPRRHKYYPVNGKVCTKAAGFACIRNLCFVERAKQSSNIPITMFEGMIRQKKSLDIANKCLGLIVGSRWMRQELLTNGIAEDKISIVPPIPASIEQAQALAPALEKHIVYVGQIIRGKGVDLLLQALSQVGGDWHASIVGEGRQLPEFKQLCLQLGLADRVNFTGPQQHLALERYYAKASFVVVPSRWPEPFGMVGIEAMARARPVVAFDSGGISDWLRHDVNGLLTPAGDIKKLASNIQQLLAEPKYAAKLGRNAVQWVNQNYSHQRFLMQMRLILQQACITSPLIARAL